MPTCKTIAAMSLVLTFVTHAAASEECTKEKSEDDRAFIESAISAGTLAKGPKGLRDSMLIQDGFWFDMNYLEQIVFMQRFECAASAGSGKKLLYMDVRSLGTGRLLATWTLGVLKPGEGRPATNNPEMSDEIEDNNHIGLTGEARAAFIKSAIDECNKKTKELQNTKLSNGFQTNAAIPRRSFSIRLDQASPDKGPNGP